MKLPLLSITSAISLTIKPVNKYGYKVVLSSLKYSNNSLRKSIEVDKTS